MERTVEVGAGRKLKIVEGNIVRIPADAIANAANGALAGGGGVDGAIHRAGGPAIMRELERIRADVGRVPAGEAVATSAGELPARWVFHAVGPIYQDGRCGEPEALRSCYRTCLDMAEERGAATISFPSISTGVYGYPVSEAARVALGEVARFLREDAASVETAVLVLFDRETYAAYDTALDALASREMARSQKAGR